MKLDMSLITEEFEIKEIVLAGDVCLWVTPAVPGVKWSNRTLILRSSIWRKDDLELVSAGLKKFFNWDECPDIYPAPKHMHAKVRCLDKLDGSCLIVSKYKGEIITRTRKALTSVHYNGSEIPELLKKYPWIVDNEYVNNGYSLIFEWCTPSNKIILPYTEPKVVLLNIINHVDYSYLPQDLVTKVAEKHNIPRPNSYKFSSIEELINIDKEKNIEGICVYYGDDQHIRKRKTTWYLDRHKFKSDLTLDNLLNIFIQQGKPKYGDFLDYIEKCFDFECRQASTTYVASLCDANTSVCLIIAGMKEFIARELSDSKLPMRKQKAARVFESYGKTNRAHMVFEILDYEELSDKNYKKLMFQCLNRT